jgi:peptide/nickel transport system substrate-binding protein
VDQDLTSLVFDGLIRLDQSGRPLPALATEWEVSEDGTVYEFRLRDDVRWHDGAPFTADDVAFTLQSMQDPNYQGPPALGEVWRNVTVEQLDAFSLRLTLEEPFPSFFYYATIGILPAHLLSNVPAGDLPSHEFSTSSPVGTGLFRVESMSTDLVTLRANGDYWGGTPFLSRVEFWLFASSDALLEAYDAGEIHGFHVEEPAQLSGLGQFPGLEFYSAPTAGYGIIFLNLQRDSLPFFQVEEVRQALLYGLDRQSLIDEMFLGQGLVAHSPVLPYMWVYDPSVRRYGYDPERAIGLLDASEWQDSDGDRIRDLDDQEFSFELLVDDDPLMVREAEQIASQWRTIGVEVTVRAVSSGAVATFVRNRNFDAALVELGLTADPDPYPLWHSTQATGDGQNFAGYASEDADVVLEEIRMTSDPERLMELYHSFQRIFAEEVPSLLLHNPVYNYAVDGLVRQVQLSPMLKTGDRFRNIGNWYMETEVIEVNPEDTLDKSGE